MTDSSTEQNSIGPGERLKTARIQKQLSVEHVADQLHLRPSIVLAIEEDDYEQLPGTTFLKGYIRSYSRLVGLSESELIEELDFRLDIQNDQDSRENLLIQKKKGKKLVSVLVSLVIVLAIVGGVIQEWPLLKSKLGIDNSQQAEQLPKVPAPPSSLDNAPAKQPEQKPSSNEPPQLDQKKTENVLGANQTGQTENIASEKESASTSTPEAASQSNSTDQTQTPSQSDTATSVSMPASQTAEAKDQPEPAPVESQTATDTANTEAPVNVEPTKVKAVRIGSIQVRFIGDCWFQMTNGLGKTVFADLKHEGDTIDYKGQLPFSFVIGAADKVSITYNNSLLDIKQYRIRNNRTAFELN